MQHRAKAERRRDQSNEQADLWYELLEAHGCLGQAEEIISSLLGLSPPGPVRRHMSLILETYIPLLSREIAGAMDKALVIDRIAGIPGEHAR